MDWTSNLAALYLGVLFSGKEREGISRKSAKGGSVSRVNLAALRLGVLFSGKEREGISRKGAKGGSVSLVNLAALRLGVLFSGKEREAGSRKGAKTQRVEEKGVTGQSALWQNGKRTGETDE